MVTLAQRIEQLRSERGLSRPALSAALGLPKGAIEKFETGRQTPTREQQSKLADYFGVSLFYLRGESSDPTRQEDWMTASYPADDPVPAPVPQPKAKSARQSDGDQATMWDALAGSRQFQELLRGIVLDVLKSPEGQAAIADAVRKELARKR